MYSVMESVFTSVACMDQAIILTSRWEDLYGGLILVEFSLSSFMCVTGVSILRGLRIF